MDLHESRHTQCNNQAFQSAPRQLYAVTHIMWKKILIKGHKERMAESLQEGITDQMFAYQYEYKYNVFDGIRFGSWERVLL